jgi:hypothetical protein
MEGLIIFFWICFAVLVGLAGKNKNIGFAGGFFLSLILSPLIAFIIVSLSKKKLDKKDYYKFLEYNELGKKAEFKGQYDQAIDHYMDSLYDLTNNYQGGNNKKIEEGRQNHIKFVTEKIETLKKLKTEQSTN